LVGGAGLAGEADPAALVGRRGFLAAGPAVTRWAWPVAAFLLFGLPWPWQLDQVLTHPLRRVATVCSTYLRQTMGLPAFSRGNIIVINRLEVGVVEACSGLGMLMTFFALSAGLALVIRSATTWPPWRARCPSRRASPSPPSRSSPASAI
jgi:exosortase